MPKVTFSKEKECADSMGKTTKKANEVVPEKKKPRRSCLSIGLIFE